MKIIWNYIKSNLMVVGLVIGVGCALFYLIRFNPLGLFSSTKISLADTPTVIKELKELGEFVTAEYSGETIESLQEGQADTERIRQKLDSLKVVFGKIQDAYIPIARRKRKDRARKKAFRELSLFSEAKDDIRLLQNATKKNLGELLEYSILEELTWSDFEERHKDMLEIVIDNKLKTGARKKIKVAYIGRGRVKAGFDLTDIENPLFGISLEPNQAKDTLTIHNLDPVILDADINPWFIYQPEAGLTIPGYELLKIKKESKVKFSDITAVKVACKQSLISQALYDREILEYAITSGEATFRDLFNLFRKPGEPELLAVRIEPTPYFEFKAEVLRDQRIERSEINEIRERLARDENAINSPLGISLIASLNKHRDWVADPESWNSLMEEAGL